MPYANVKPFSLNLSWNDGLVDLLNSTDSIQHFQKMGDGKGPMVNSMRISDASGIYHEVFLRSHEKHSRPLLRPIAVLSDLFTTKRTKSINANKLTKTPPLPPRKQHNANGNNENGKKVLKKKKSIWNVLTKAKRYSKHMQLFPEKIDDKFSSIENIDYYPSVAAAAGANPDIDSNLFEFNDDDFDLIDMRPSEILNRLTTDNTNLCSTVLPKQQHFNISSNILWSHNLSMSQLANGDVSNVNLLGANANKEQILSEVFIEEDTVNHKSPNARRCLRFSISNVDNNGYATMHPILSKTKIPENQRNAINDDVTKNINFCRDYDYQCMDLLAPQPQQSCDDSFGDGSSSGFSSDTEDVSPQLTHSLSFELSPTKSNDEAISMSFIDMGQITPTSCNKISSRKNLFSLETHEQIEPRKLVNLHQNRSANNLMNESSSSEQFVNNVNVDATVSLLNIASESTKNVRKGTPYKLTATNQIKIYSDNVTIVQSSQQAEQQPHQPVTLTIDMECIPFKNISNNNILMQSIEQQNKQNGKNVYVHNAFPKQIDYRSVDKTSNHYANQQNQQLTQTQFDLQFGTNKNENVPTTSYDYYNNDFDGKKALSLKSSFSKLFIKKCSEFRKKINFMPISCDLAIFI